MLKCNGCGWERPETICSPGSPHNGCDFNGIWGVVADRIWINDANLNNYVLNSSRGCVGKIVNTVKQARQLSGIAAIASEDLQKLREDNAAYLKTVHDLERENGRLREAWRAEQTRANVEIGKNDDAVDYVQREASKDCQRLRMELADVRQTLSAQHYVTLSMGDELSFCKAEIRRLDPRLWAARWGR